jgi:zinc/manganese transport system substrate-binding protein
VFEQTKMRLSLRLRIVAATVSTAFLVAACGVAAPQPAPDGPSVVVTYSVLGSVVRELVGDRAQIEVLMGKGVDPHDWSPSARDMETVMNADLVIANGLGLEEGLVQALEEAARAGVTLFYATDHIEVREIGHDDPAHKEHKEEEHKEEEHKEEHKHYAGDPHFWVDPVAMKQVVAALTVALAQEGIDVADRGADLEQRLADLDAEVRSILAVVPEANRKLVTGHESMGYFADRYGFTLVGAVIPGLGTHGEVSARELADLKVEIEREGVPTIFSEIGTPTAVVEAISRETGARVVELPSHTLPADESYFTFIREIATAVADGLR